MAEHAAWSLTQKWELPDAAWPAWPGDGIFVRSHDAAIADLVRKMRIPVVFVEPTHRVDTMPWVGTDNTAVGSLAAEHLLDRGFRHFGFCGCNGVYYSDMRRDGFVQRLQQSGFSCDVYVNAALPSQAPQTDALADWLAALPKPGAVMSDSTYRGRELLTACRRKNLAVPEEVSILTVKSDDENDFLEFPPLSCVRLNIHRVGYEAAALLDRMMSEGLREPPGTGHRVAPLTVVSRQSTDMLAIPDPQVADALRFIWQHACEGIHVSDVAKMVPHSRRKFEQQFQNLVGRTPHEEIVRVQMNQIKAALDGTDLALDQIAERTGFANAKNLVTAFHRETGLTPGKYRSRYKSAHSR